MTEAPTSVREWRLHLGAHKTASTHLQSRLKAARDQLAEAGRDFIPLRDLRDLNLRALRRRDPVAWLGDWGLRRSAAARLAPMRRPGAAVVILSDEDFLGFADDALSAPIYPAAERRLRALRALTRAVPVRLFLAVRSWDGYLPSAYVQMLRRTPQPGGFEAVRRRALAAPPSWADLATRLTALFPAAELTVWRYEDYRANARAIAAAVVGADPGPDPDIPPPAHTRGGSAAAVAAAERLDPALTPDARRRRVAELFVDPALAGPAFAPFPADERAGLQARYAEDLAAIADMPRTRLLRFEVAARSMAAGAGGTAA